MKRKISVMLVLVFYVSVGLSSMSFASSNTSVTGHTGDYPANGALHWFEQDRIALAYTGAGGNSYVEAEVEFKYILGSTQTVELSKNIDYGYTAANARALAPRDKDIIFVAARGRHLARSANGTWHPTNPNDGSRWSTWINKWI